MGIELWTKSTSKEEVDGGLPENCGTVIGLHCQSVSKCTYKGASYKPFIRCHNAYGLRDALVTSVLCTGSHPTTRRNRTTITCTSMYQQRHVDVS